MKKAIMTALMFTILICVANAQTKTVSPNHGPASSFNPYKDHASRYLFKDDLLVLTMENGFNGLRDVKFRLDEDTYNKIKETEVFKMWVHEQDSIKKSGESAKYYEKKAGWDDVVWFLDSKVRSVMEISVKYDMKERYSYDFVEDSYNFIYVKDGEVKV